MSQTVSENRLSEEDEKRELKADAYSGLLIIYTTPVSCYHNGVLYPYCDNVHVSTAFNMMNIRGGCRSLSGNYKQILSDFQMIEDAESNINFVIMTTDPDLSEEHKDKVRAYLSDYYYTKGLRRRSLSLLGAGILLGFLVGLIF